MEVVDWTVVCLWFVNKVGGGIEGLTMVLAPAGVVDTAGGGYSAASPDFTAPDDADNCRDRVRDDADDVDVVLKCLRGGIAGPLAAIVALSICQISLSLWCLLVNGRGWLVPLR